MKDQSKTKQALIQELVSLRNRISELERSESERKRAAEMLWESEEGLRTIFDRASDGILIADAISKKLLHGNATICSMLGYTKEEIESLSINDIHPPKDIPHVLDEFEKQVKREKVVAEDLPVLRKDGSIFYADISSAPTTVGGRHYLVSIFRDITDRRHMEDSLRRNDEELSIESEQLAEANIALRVLLRHREEDRKAMEKNFINNIQKLILPYFQELRKLRLSPSQSSYLDIIDANLQQVMNPFLQNITARFTALTPREIQISNLIREGKTSKEIADFIKTAPRSVEFHRNNIRKKLGLSGKKTNLRSFLLSLSEIIFA